jgi:hypothetical protein
MLERAAITAAITIAFRRLSRSSSDVLAPCMVADCYCSNMIWWRGEGKQMPHAGRDGFLSGAVGGTRASTSVEGSLQVLESLHFKS